MACLTGLVGCVRARPPTNRWAPHPLPLTRSCAASRSAQPEGFLSQVLAHELGHVYLHLQGFPELSPTVSEGVCDCWVKVPPALSEDTAPSARLALLRPQATPTHLGALP